jgi:SAM-dependent methyltransferase
VAAASRRSQSTHPYLRDGSLAERVRYEVDDAQVHRFDPAGFDVAISRFGTFFSDPAAAFANIAAALRPEARLVLLVWQRYEHNEWARAIDAALGNAAAPPPPGATRSRSANPEVTACILEGAGFEGIRFEDVHEPVLYGHGLDAALEFVRGLRSYSSSGTRPRRRATLAGRPERLSAGRFGTPASG